MRHEAGDDDRRPRRPDELAEICAGEGVGARLLDHRLAGLRRQCGDEGAAFGRAVEQAARLAAMRDMDDPRAGLPGCGDKFGRTFDGRRSALQRQGPG